MKQQRVVRTYPKEFLDATKDLSSALKSGWVVILSNPFDAGRNRIGTEYILEKEVVK